MVRDPMGVGNRCSSEFTPNACFDRDTVEPSRNFYRAPKTAAFVTVVQTLFSNRFQFSDLLVCRRRICINSVLTGLIVTRNVT